MQSPLFRSRSGFTLVELLVVTVVYFDGSSGMFSPADLRAIDTKGGANPPFWKAIAN